MRVNSGRSELKESPEMLMDADGDFVDVDSIYLYFFVR